MLLRFDSRHLQLYTAFNLNTTLLGKSNFFNFHRSIKGSRSDRNRQAAGAHPPKHNCCSHSPASERSNIFWTKTTVCNFCMATLLSRVKQRLLWRTSYFILLNRCMTLTWRYSDVKLTQISCILSDLQPTLWLQNSSRVVKTYAKLELYCTSLASYLAPRLSFTVKIQLREATSWRSRCAFRLWVDTLSPWKHQQKSTGVS